MMVIIQSLIAQAAADPISGGAGWVGAGLLGAVLTWLMLKHLPDKDKQIKDLVDSHNVRVDGIITRHDVSLESQRVSFKTALDSVINHCALEGERLREDLVVQVDQKIKNAISIVHMPSGART